MTTISRWMKPVAVAIVRSLRWWWRYGLRLLMFALLFIALVPRSTVHLNDVATAIGFAVSEHQFDYIGWELSAIAVKANQTLFGQHAYVTEANRTQAVRDYFSDLARAQALEAQITQIFTDPTITEPDQASADLQAERDALRASLGQRQATIEAILEGQVAALLVEEGFGIAGQLLPPMAMHFTQVPNLLVVSPRDEIRLETTINLYHLPIDEQAAMEAALDQRYDVSTLTVPLGGIALYPAMIYETSSLVFAIETFAHEWLHHYLYFFPLGLSYFSGDGFAGEARIVNETTADLFGKEVARLVLARYYPDLLPPEPQPAPPNNPTPPVIEPEPDAFDFAAEMNETRVTVDALLADGDVDAAEAYMDERQVYFFQNGYRIRKINQAFFAFYGGYQAGGGIAGAGGADPIGPAIRQIRQNSASLREFVLHMRPLTSREGLLALAERLE